MDDVPTEKRGAIHSLATALGISATTTVHRLKTGQGYDVSIIRPHSNAIKPYLEDAHLSARAYYARSKLDLATGLCDGFYQSVHVDETCFFMTREQLFLYLSIIEVEEGKVLVRKVAHKSHIVKVMFLAATARPRYDAGGNCTFDGEIL
jgi:hypothetical protein